MAKLLRDASSDETIPGIRHVIAEFAEKRFGGGQERP